MVREQDGQRRQKRGRRNAGLSALARRRETILAVAVTLTDRAIATMDEELGLLVLADFPPAINRLLLGIGFFGYPGRSAFADGPSVVVRDDMVRGKFAHDFLNLFG